MERCEDAFLARYSVGRMARTVNRVDHPQLLATVIPLNKKQLLETSVCDEKLTGIEQQAKATTVTDSRPRLSDTAGNFVKNTS